MRENQKMEMNRIILIFMYLLQFVLLQKKEFGEINRNGNMFYHGRSAIIFAMCSW